jgi:hypothetical protein
MKSRSVSTKGRRRSGAPAPDPPAKAQTEVEVVRLLWMAIFVSVFSFLFYYRRGDVLWYGDAVAHINIARRVFDSRTPGLLQLGTVWLPLPHLLILPFIVSKQMWQSGSGGSIPSMAGFVFGVLGIVRLTRTALAKVGEVDDWAKMAGWAAAVFYVANPNLIYMQATAMGESLYLAFFIWAVSYFAESWRGNEKALTKCGICLLAACLTRYDGWFLAGVLGVCVAARAVVKLPLLAEPARSGATQAFFSRITVARFILLAAAGPALWLGYNTAVYGNALEFANGPYSAKAIERNTGTVNPAKGNLAAAGAYFLKAAELNVSEPTWMGRLWLGLAVLGSLAAWRERRGRVALVLWTPLVFYGLSLAYGSVPIFVPVWWPFSIYNARYGLQLLPAFAVFVPWGIFFLVRGAARLWAAGSFLRRWAELMAFAATMMLAVSSYAGVWRGRPICYREAENNMKGRVAMDSQIGKWMQALPQDSILLMYLGEHAGALEGAGIPLKRTINEGNHRVWKRPDDPQGLWERALADPAGYANYAIGFEGDPVWKAAMAGHLKALVEIHTTGQPAAVIFQGRAN